MTLLTQQSRPHTRKMRYIRVNFLTSDARVIGRNKRSKAFFQMNSVG